MMRIHFLYLCLAFCLPGFAAEVVYTKADSLRVVELLSKGAAVQQGTNLPLFYAHQLENVPYVAATLEKNKTEKLVVNLYELDCTTLVETVVALTLTTVHGSQKWSDYLEWLEKVRYRGGHRDGYASRNHYFSQWIDSNEELKLVCEQHATPSGNFFPFTKTQKLDLHYMSQHPNSYPMLKGSDALLKEIRCYEEASSGKVVRYIPSSLVGRDKQTLKYVQDGDILAIVTSKDGLDVCHLGLAEWGKDGKLHLFNASSIHKKVVYEPMTLQQYMSQHPTQLGIRVIRINGK